MTKRLLLALACAAITATLCTAQMFVAAGYNPSAFAVWSYPVTGHPVLATGSATITFPAGAPTIQNGPAFQPLAADVPLTVEDGSHTETVTPSAVSCSGATCTLTATFGQTHLGSYTLVSADAGLQEAVNWAEAHGGGEIIVGPSCPACNVGALTSGSVNVPIQDTRTYWQLYTWNAGNGNYQQRVTVDGTAVWMSGTAEFITPKNDCSGISAAMVAGAVTVSNSCITGSRPISLTEAAKSGTQGTLSYTQSAGSLTITSSSSSDTSTVAWVQN